MAGEINKGRAYQLLKDAPNEGLQPILQWLINAVSFLLNRYIMKD